MRLIVTPLLAIALALAADPTATGKRLGGGATGEVYLLTRNGRSGVVKVPKEDTARYLRALEESLPDYRTAAKLYGGAQLYDENLVDVKLPDGRVTKGIFMERIEGIRLDEALEIMRLADTPARGRQEVARKVGFPLSAGHYKALIALEERLLRNGHALYDLNAENIFLVPGEKGFIRIVDPTIENVGTGIAAEKDIEKAMDFVRYELGNLIGAAEPVTLRSPTARCVVNFSLLAQ